MMIQFDESKIKMSLKETSLDDNGTEYLVQDQDEVCNFDEISNQIGKQLRLGNQPHSCDALHIGKQYNYLIEFKNMKSSDVKKQEQPGLHMKAYDSIFQLMLYLGTKGTIDQVCTKTRLVVVYNDMKGAMSANTDVANSPSIEKIVQKLKKFANFDELDALPKKFKLDRLQGLLYERVLTVDVKDFNNGIKNLIMTT